jgi:hypothetical protein
MSTEREKKMDFRNYKKITNRVGQGTGETSEDRNRRMRLKVSVCDQTT